MFSKQFQAITSRQQFANLAHESLPPILPSACSRNTATTARSSNYTALLLLNKRVRGVVHGGNGLLHLRHRVSTYGAVTANCAAIGIGTKRGMPSSSFKTCNGKIYEERTGKTKGHQSTHHQQKVREARAQNRHQLPSARSPNTATTARSSNYTALLLLNKRVRGVVHGGNGLLHLRPRVHLQRDNQKPASLSASVHRHLLPSSIALSGKKELAKHSMPILAASTIA
jgi:hypothetical protein